MTRFLAVDPSLTCTGLAFDVAHVVETDTFVPDGRGVLRLANAHAWLRAWCDEDAPDVVGIEGYAFSAQASRSHALGELGGVLRLALHLTGVPFVEIPPKSLKLYAAGKGNAKKAIVQQAASLRAGRVFETNDEADAWWLWQMMAAHYEPEHPALVTMPKANRMALRGVTWPLLAVAH